SSPSTSPSATISSVARTLSPSATIRCASRSMAAASESPRRARAWPAESTPAATLRLLKLPPRARDLGGQLLLGAAEVLEQLRVGGGLLQRVQLAAVQVLQQRVPEHVD